MEAKIELTSGTESTTVFNMGSANEVSGDADADRDCATPEMEGNNEEQWSKTKGKQLRDYMW